MIETKLNTSEVEHPALKKCITLFDAVFYGVGVIIGAGIYALIGEAAGIAGNAIWLSFVVAAIIASFTALSYAELAAAFPRSAAEFVYVKNAFRIDIIAFVVGIMTVFESIVSAAAVALGFAGYFVAFFLSSISPPLFSLALIIVAIMVIIICSIISFIGIKESARLNIIFTLLEAGGLITVILLSLPFWGKINYFELPINALSLFDYISPIALGAALVFFAYIGFEHIANIAEETTEAVRTVPKALLISLVITTLLYVAVSISVVSVIPYNELAASKSPLALVASALLGSTGKQLLTFIALFATANTVMLILIVGSRRLYGMAHEHDLPKPLAAIHPKTKTPYIAIATIAIFSIFFVFLVLGEIKTIAFLANYCIFFSFFMVNVSLLILRFKLPKAEVPFRAPFNIGNFSITAFLGAASSLFMLIQLATPVKIGGFEIPLLAFGLLVTLTLGVSYYIYKKYRPIVK